VAILIDEEEEESEEESVPETEDPVRRSETEPKSLKVQHQQQQFNQVGRFLLTLCNLKRCVYQGGQTSL
jgi:hypothetical protein